MKVSELITQLQELPQNQDVHIRTHENSEGFNTFEIESIKTKNVSFREDPDSEALASDDVVLIEIIVAD